VLLRSIPFIDEPVQELEALRSREEELRDGSRYLTERIMAGGREWCHRCRRDPEVATTWTLQHWIEDDADLAAWLELPALQPGGQAEVSGFLRLEQEIGESGLVGLDIPDPLCLAAELFDMGSFTIAALTEPQLFRRLLDRQATWLLPRVEAIAAALPGRLWRIYGPEYACPPYLPPALFREYVCGYDRQLVEIIHRSGGWARIHCHGRVVDVLPDIVGIGADAIDPLEPPPQGDAELRMVRERWGEQLCIFGNLEISDLENRSEPEMRRIIAQTLQTVETTSGRGFVLMPSSAPYGRKLPQQTRRNFELMIEMVTGVPA
jgi:hypothetical protein